MKKEPITRNRKPVSFLTTEEVKEYLEMHKLTQHQFADRLGIGYTTAYAYIHGLSPVPYSIAKLMYFVAQFGKGQTGPADTRLMKNMHRTRMGEAPLMYMSPKELKRYMEQMRLDRETLADLLGYRSFRPVQNWLDGKAHVKYCDAKLMQYFAEEGTDVAYEEIPVIDEILDGIRGKKRDLPQEKEARELPDCLQ